MDYSFLEISFAHYEAFGGPFFNHFIGGITQLFSAHPSDYWREFTLVFWMMSSILFVYSMISSWEVKQSFKYWYDWEMPWRNPIKKILFGNVLSRYFVALAILYSAFLPIPVVQMTPVVATSLDGSNEIRAWVVNDMKTSIDEELSSGKYTDYSQYKGLNQTTAHIPMLFLPISWFEEFYYGFPGIDESTLFDVKEYEKTGKYLMRKGKMGTDLSRGTTLLSCIDDDELRMDVINDQEASISLKSRLSISLEDFSCDAISNPNSPTAQSAKDGFASVLFGLDVASAGYKDFFSPIDNIFELIMVNSFTSVINQGVNLARTPTSGNVVKMGDTKLISDDILKYSAELAVVRQSIDANVTKLITALNVIREKGAKEAMPMELIDLLFYRLQSNNDYKIDTYGNQVENLIWARNGDLPEVKEAGKIISSSKAAEYIMTGINIASEASTAKPTSQYIRSAELKYMAAQIANGNTEANFKAGLCGVCDRKNDYYQPGATTKDMTDAIKARMFDSVKQNFGYDNEEAIKINKSTNFSISGNQTHAKLSFDWTEDSQDTIKTFIEIPMSSIPTQSTGMKIGYVDYTPEALNNAVFKYLDKAIISARITDAYIDRMVTRIHNFSVSYKAYAKDDRTTAFKSDHKAQVTYKDTADEEITGTVQNALFGYYKSVYFATTDPASRTTVLLADNETFLNFRSKGTVILPIEAITHGNGLDSYEIAPGEHAQDLQFADKIMHGTSIWKMANVKNPTEEDITSIDFVIGLVTHAQSKQTKESPDTAQLNIFSKILYDIRNRKIEVISHKASSASSGASYAIDDDDIGSLKAWFNKPDSNGEYTDKFNLESEFNKLFTKDSIFFAPSGFAGKSVDPATKTTSTIKDYGLIKNFGNLTKYYNHKSVIEPWSFSSENTEVYQERRSAMVRALRGDSARQRFMGFKNIFLQMVSSMRPYVEVGNNIGQSTGTKIIFSNKYMIPLVEKYGAIAKVQADEDFITTLAKIVNHEITTKNKSFSTTVGFFMDKQNDLETAIKNGDKDAIDAAKVALNDSLVAIDYAAMDSNKDGMAMRFITVWFGYNWKLTTIVLNFLREFQNTVISETTDTFAGSGYSFYPEFLIGNYHTYGPEIKIEVASNTITPSDSDESVWMTTENGVPMRCASQACVNGQISIGYHVVTGTTTVASLPLTPPGKTKYVLPSGAIPPWSNNSTLFGDTKDTIVKMFSAVGFNMETLVGAGIVAGTAGGVYAVGKLAKSAGKKVLGTAGSVLSVGAQFAKDFIIPVLLFFIMLLFGLFWLTLRFIIILVRVIVLGIMSGLIGFFNATLIVPIIFFLRFAVYNPNGDSQSPLHNLINKIPGTKETIIKAGKQLTVWIASVTVIFILIYVHTNVFYPYAQELSFNVWINTSTSNDLSSWTYAASLIFIALIYYYLVNYSYQRLMKYMQTISIESDSDVIKSAKDMMTKNSGMLGKLQKMSTSGNKGGITRK